MQPAHTLATTSQSQLPSVEALQDLLYDILAVGVDSDASAVTANPIETFLHEHARSPKPHAAFVAFFREQGLSWSSARPVSPAAEPLPALKLVSRPPAAAQPQAETLAPPAPAEPSVASGVSVSGAVRPPQALTLAFVCVGLLAVLFGAALYVGYGQLRGLSAELEATRLESQAQARALAALQADLVNVQSGVVDNGQVIERMDKKSDLLIEALIPSTPAE